MFENRSKDPEIMDDLEFQDEVVFQTLKELDIINSYLGGNSVTFNALKKVIKKVGGRNVHRHVSVADLGCGSGDLLKKIAIWASKNKVPANLLGVDANPSIIDYASKYTSAFPEIKYEVMNVLSNEFKKKQFDIVICTLFLHHFEDQNLIDLLKQLRKQTSKAIIINDIHRHWLAYYSIYCLTSLFSKSYMVKYDAKLSVLRAFTKSELERIIKASGFTNYTISWKWAFRYQVILYV